MPPEQKLFSVIAIFYWHTINIKDVEHRIKKKQ